MSIWGKCLKIYPLRTSGLLVGGQTRVDAWFSLALMKTAEDVWQLLGNYSWGIVRWVRNQFLRTEEILLGQI